MHKKIIQGSLIFIAFIISTVFSSCSKEWLEAKPRQSLVVPKKIENFQALLDDDYNMNNGRPGIGDIGSDGYYLTLENWKSISSPYQVQSHVWGDDIYGGFQFSSDWRNNYTKIYIANLVLEGLAELEPGNAELAAYNNAKGGALFFRAMALHDLAQVFCKAYDKNTAATDPGIPVRLNSMLTEISVRGTVLQVYNQVIQDLEQAVPLMREQQHYLTRPSKTAALALLARVYLSMEEYAKALEYANQALDIQSSLMDYNTAPYGTASTFKEFNEEVIFHGRVAYFAVIDVRSDSRAFFDTVWYQSYSEDDLRKTRYFNIATGGHVQFVGDYGGDAYPATSGYFGGLATDELYLIKAECEARAGKKDDAMSTLNQLLETRWKTGTFVPFTAATSDEALEFILTERRKSLLFRGLRWSDLRRLNRDSRFATTLKREFSNGETYTLEPNSVRYVWPIPPDEIALSQLEQNPR